MGNIGIDVSKEELARQCMEWRKVCNELQTDLNVAGNTLDTLCSILKIPKCEGNDYQSLIGEVRKLISSVQEMHTHIERNYDLLEFMGE